MNDGLIRKLKCPKCGFVWEVSPGGYWTNCPNRKGFGICGEPIEIEKVTISARE